MILLDKSCLVCRKDNDNVFIWKWSLAHLGKFIYSKIWTLCTPKSGVISIHIHQSLIFAYNTTRKPRQLYKISWLISSTPKIQEAKAVVKIQTSVEPTWVGMQCVSQCWTTVKQCPFSREQALLCAARLKTPLIFFYWQFACLSLAVGQTGLLHLHYSTVYTYPFPSQMPTIDSLYTYVWYAWRIMDQLILVVLTSFS